MGFEVLSGIEKRLAMFAVGFSSQRRPRPTCLNPGLTPAYPGLTGLGLLSPGLLHQAKSDESANAAADSPAKEMNFTFTPGEPHISQRWPNPA